MKRSERTTTFLTPRQRGHRDRLHGVPEARTHWFTWRHIRFKLTETPNPSFNGWLVLRLDAIASRDTPVPVTPTGFLMHAMDAEALADAGGAVAFITVCATPTSRRSVHYARQKGLRTHVLIT